MKGAAFVSEGLDEANREALFIVFCKFSRNNCNKNLLRVSIWMKTQYSKGS